MRARFDAIVVGARVAGASTALLLARKGYRVLLVDRARFPSDVPHGHFIHKDGPRRLQDWGLLERIVAAGTPAIDTVTTYFGDFPLVSRNLRANGIAWGYGPRRVVIDETLVEAAVLAGAEFRESFSVDQLTFDDGRVTGIRGRAKSGTPVAERASITIGADGRNSRVARAVAAHRYQEVPPLLCYYFSYWSGMSAVDLTISNVGERLVFSHPTNDGLSAVFVGWPVGMFHEVRSNVERHFLGVVDSVPDLGDQLRAGTREERFYGTADLPNFFRKPYGSGWALVGDAGYHKDPYLALGMSDALRSADLLAQAVDDGLSGRQPLPQALEGYERRRNEASMSDYQENLAWARMDPISPDVMELRRALREAPEQATRFWMARVGMIPREEFFNPENIRQLMATVQTPAAPAAAHRAQDE